MFVAQLGPPCMSALPPLLEVKRTRRPSPIRSGCRFTTRVRLRISRVEAPAPSGHTASPSTAGLRRPSSASELDLSAPAFAAAAVPTHHVGPGVRAPADHVGHDRDDGFMLAQAVIAPDPAPIPMKLFGQGEAQGRPATPVAHCDARRLRPLIVAVAGSPGSSGCNPKRTC